MNIKKYRQIRTLVSFFIAFFASMGIVQENKLLTFLAAITGFIFLSLVRSKTKIVVDEREKQVREKAAQLTYALFTPTIGFSALILATLGHDAPYLSALSQILAYLTLFLIALYSLSFYYLNRQYGGNGEE